MLLRHAADATLRVRDALRLMLDHVIFHDCFTRRVRAAAIVFMFDVFALCHTRADVYALRYMLIQDTPIC